MITTDPMAGAPLLWSLRFADYAPPLLRGTP